MLFERENVILTVARSATSTIMVELAEHTSSRIRLAG